MVVVLWIVCGLLLADVVLDPPAWWTWIEYRIRSYSHE